MTASQSPAMVQSIPAPFKPMDSRTNPSSSRRLRAGSDARGIRPGNSPNSPSPVPGRRRVSDRHDLGSWDAIGIELIVPGGIERVRPVDALAVTADLDHLRAARVSAAVRVGHAPAMPPIRTEPVSLGFLGSVTSY